MQLFFKENHKLKTNEKLFLISLNSVVAVAFLNYKKVAADNRRNAGSRSPQPQVSTVRRVVCLENYYEPAGLVERKLAPEPCKPSTELLPAEVAISALAASDDVADLGSKIVQ